MTLPDHTPPEHLPPGGVNAQLAALQARIRELELALSLAERVLLAQRSTRGDVDSVLERVARALGPGRAK